MIRSLVSAVALFSFWLLLSGMFVPFLLAAGFGCAIAIKLFSKRLSAIAEESDVLELNWGKFIVYCPWLVEEIIVAAWDVSKRILSPRLPISPALVEFVPSQKTDVGLVIHANSITLTPGTISVEAEHGRFLVHALTEGGAKSLAGSEMDRRCAELEEV
ncbi:MAG: Cation antiporter [Proteobacteria bacterium]|nr:Cation antiporter [Pseudomonadota bacterium]